MAACGGKETETDGIQWDETAGGPVVKSMPVLKSGKGRGKKYPVDMGRFGETRVGQGGGSDQPALCWR